MPIGIITNVFAVFIGTMIGGSIKDMFLNL